MLSKLYYPKTKQIFPKTYQTIFPYKNYLAEWEELIFKFWLYWIKETNKDALAIEITFPHPIKLKIHNQNIYSVKIKNNTINFTNQFQPTVSEAYGRLRTITRPSVPVWDKILKGYEFSLAIKIPRTQDEKEIFSFKCYPVMDKGKEIMVIEIIPGQTSFSVTKKGEDNTIHF